MSTIRVDNFGPSAGGTTYSARGIAKAWVNFDGTGTIAARDSENVSSLTDDGTGKYDVNFTSAFAAADYSAVVDGAFNTDDTSGSVVHTLRRISLSTSFVGVRCFTPGGAFSDSEVVTTIVAGDLA
jgi:hypothetical protein